MEIVASLSQGRTAAAQCGLFAHKSVPVIFEPPCIIIVVIIIIITSLWDVQAKVIPVAQVQLETSKSHSENN